MKQRLYIYGVLTAQIIITGVIFKINHWPGAGILLTIGIVNLAIGFIPAALVSLYRGEDSKDNKTLYIVTFVTCLVIFIGMLFKIQHWPNAGVFLLIALPFPYLIFLPVFLVVTGRKNNYSIYNVVAVLTLLAFFSVFSALLALNVSKTKIVDSYNLANDNITLSNAIQTTDGTSSNQPVADKIAEAIIIINEYKSILLGGQPITSDQYDVDMNLLNRSTTVSAGWILLEDGGEEQPGSKLVNALEEVVAGLSVNNKTRDLASVVLSAANIKDPEWTKVMFAFNTLSWTLVELNALETNLKLVMSAL